MRIAFRGFHPLAKFAGRAVPARCRQRQGIRIRKVGTPSPQIEQLAIGGRGAREIRLRILRFRQNLQSDGELTTGRLDSRFSGPDLDPLSQRADYDPQASALGSAYVTAFNEYARKELRYGEGKVFKPSVQLFRTWNFSHQMPGQTQTFSPRQGTNVMPDLANAMKLNPNLKVQLHAGYFDLATPFYQGLYEMHHLPIPQNLQANIEFRFYESGHMVYAKDASLRQLHDNVADLIRRTSHAAQ